MQPLSIATFRFSVIHISPYHSHRLHQILISNNVHSFRHIVIQDLRAIHSSRAPAARNLGTINKNGFEMKIFRVQSCVTLHRKGPRFRMNACAAERNAATYTHPRYIPLPTVKFDWPLGYLLPCMGTNRSLTYNATFHFPRKHLAITEPRWLFTATESTQSIRT